MTNFKSDSTKTNAEELIQQVFTDNILRYVKEKGVQYIEFTHNGAKFLYSDWLVEISIKAKPTRKRKLKKTVNDYFTLK